MGEEFQDDELTKPGGLTRSERRAQRRSDSGVQVNKLHFPLPMVITLMAMVITATGAWWRTTAHADSHTLHNDEAAVIAGGGVAYKADVTRLQYEFEVRMRHVLTGLRVTCRYSKGTMESVCSLSLPETE